MKPRFFTAILQHNRLHFEFTDQDFDVTQLNNLKARQTDLTNSLTELEIEINELDNQLEIANFWYEGLSTSGVISLLLDSAIPFINERIKYYLEILAGTVTYTGSGISSKFIGRE